MTEQVKAVSCTQQSFSGLARGGTYCYRLALDTQPTIILDHPEPVAMPAQAKNTQAKTTVPSAQDVLVPETLLKKRRDDAKSREANQAKLAEARKVSIERRETW